MEIYCKYNPTGNPYWCNVIWGYCQFQTPDTVNEHCPIFQGYPNWPIHVHDITLEFILTHSYMTIYDDDHIIALGDTAFQKCDAIISMNAKFIRYIGKYAFQDCVNFKTLDFTGKESDDDEIPVLASPYAFSLSDTSPVYKPGIEPEFHFINDIFEILVPMRLYDKWINSPNWTTLKDHIRGVN